VLFSVDICVCNCEFKPEFQISDSIQPMKKAILAALLTLGTLLGAKADTNTVVSVNAVGYVNVVIPTGFSMVANPLNGTTNTISSLFPVAPFTSTIYKWNGSSFDPYFWIGTNSWYPDVTLAPGEGVFIYTPSKFTNTFVGEVLTGNLQNPLPAGFSIKSSMIPVSTALVSSTNSTGTSSIPLSNGDTVYYFNNSTGSYDYYTWFQNQWLPLSLSSTNSPSVPTPKVGEAFWFYKGSSNVWNMTFSIN